jgi:alpha-methylacyl-CoA racemase
LLKKRFSEVFGGKTRDEWAVLLEGTDACFAPVLDLAEASQHPHNLARCNFEEHVGGVVLGRNAPRSWPLSDQVKATDQETNR